MSVWYNENNPQKAAWLRELIRQNVIAPGEVDERSITEVDAAELRDFTQCHFFAGIGVWSYSLRLAGWDHDRPVWSGSCPCPSFSAAGKGGGFNDPRHLWPAWSRLIGECRPATIFGEQADDAIGYGWLDLVQTNLERADYAVGKAVLGACSVGAPHIRQRLYFCAHLTSPHPRSNQSRTERENAGNHSEAAFGEMRPDDNAALSSRGCKIERSSDSTEARRADAREHGSGQSLLPARSIECGGVGHRDLRRSGEQRLLAEDGGTSECLQSDSAGLFPRRENSKAVGYRSSSD